MITIKDLIKKGTDPNSTQHERVSVVIDIQKAMGVEVNLEHWNKIKNRWDSKSPIESRTTLFTAIINSAYRTIALDLKIENVLQDERFLTFHKSLIRIPLKKGRCFDVNNVLLMPIFEHHGYLKGGANKTEREDEFLSFLDNPVAAWVCPITKGYLFELSNGHFHAWSSDHSVTSKDMFEAAVPSYFNVDNDV